MNIGLSFVGVSMLSVFIALPLGWVIGTVGRQLRIKRAAWYWRRHTIIYAEYEPPDNLRPGEIAFLYDRSFGEAELLATLFDLELRKKVILSNLPSKNDAVDFRIRVVSKVVADDLRDFEQETLATLKGYGQTATWSQLKLDTAIWDSNIETHLESELQQKDYFRQGSTSFWSTIGFVAFGMIMAGLTVVLPTATSEHWLHKQPVSPGDTYAGLNHDIATFEVTLLWSIAAVAYGLAFYFAVSAYRRAMDLEKGTPHLRTVWPHIEGFRQYIRVVDQERIQFENQELTVHARQQALPYAVALNLSTKWQARFSGN